MPVQIDRTWLLLAAFITFIVWRAGRDLGTAPPWRTSSGCVRRLLVSVLVHEGAHAVSARRSGSASTGWWRTSGVGTRHTTHGRRHPGRRRSSRRGPRRQPRPRGRRALAAASCRRRHPSSRDRVVVVNVLLAVFNLLPGCRSTAASSSTPSSGGSPGGASGPHRRRAGADGSSPSGLVLGSSRCRSPGGRPTSVDAVVVSLMAWSCGRARRPRSGAGRRGSCARIRPEDVLDPVARRAR